MKKRWVAFSSALFLFGLTTLSWAGYELKISDETKANFGFKAQIWGQSAGDAAPSKSDSKTDFAVRAARLYMNGQVVPLIKFGTNLDWAKGAWDGGASKDTVALSDASITFDVRPEAKVLTGLFRTPFSRTALQDSYQYLLPHPPEIAGGSYVGNLKNYRNVGLTPWGEALGGKVKYAVGLFDGDLTPPGEKDIAVSNKDNPFYAVRLAASLLDPETGYTNAGTYLGKKRILTIGAGYLASRYRRTSTKTADTVADLQTGIVTAGKTTTETIDQPSYAAWTVDAFTEIPLAGGALTVEGAWFNYDRDIDKGKTNGFYATLAYFIPVIKLQPVLRYEASNRDGAVTGGEDFKKWAAGLGYFIKGNDAKVNLEYANKDYGKEGTTPRTEKGYADITLALQVQF